MSLFQRANEFFITIRFLIFCLTAFLASANAQYRFDSWTTDNALPQNGIRAITQTPDGYLWFTTFDGLVRFDGVRFTVFDKGNTKGIINNRFSVLHTEKDGTLWAATEDGVMTIYRNGVFTSYPNDQLPGSHVHKFVRDANGETRIFTPKGYYYFRNNQFVFSSIEEPQNLEKKIYHGKSGRVWTITKNETTEEKNGREMIYRLKLKDLAPIDSPPSSIYEDRRGGLWLGQIGEVYHLSEGSITIYTKKDGIAANASPHSFWEEDDGSLWFATGNQNFAGFGLFQLKDGHINRFGMEVGLSNDRIISIFKDREGTIWLATNKGLNRLRRQVITSLSTKDGLINNEVYPIMQSRSNEILIGTAEGLSRYHNGKFINNHLKGPNVPGFENLQALFEDAKGRLWIGVVGGLVILENGRKASPNIEGTATSIIADKNGNIWVGSWGGGLFKFSDDKITARYTTNEGLPNNDVKVVHEDRNGTLWIGTYGGLSQFKDGKFTNYTTRERLPSDRVRSIYEDADGTFWIGTYDGGLSRFKGGKFFNFTVDNGLFNNGVFATLEDNHGFFWMSCNKGIYRVNKQQLNDFADGKIVKYDCIAFGKEDGMLNTECNGGRQPSALKANDGKLWFPTLEGVAIVDPDAVTTNPQAPPVEIETVAIDREPTTLEKLQSAIRNPQSAIEIGSSQTSLDITYTGLSFIKSDQIRFKYKLEGLDKDWIDAGMRRSVNYSYLPPGNYTFKVIAANSDGVWNNEGKSISVVVYPPFYRTWYFYLLCTVFVAGICVLVYTLRVRGLKQKANEQEAFARRLIESQEQERKRIASELHDSLGQNLLLVKNWALMGLNVASNENPTREHLNEISETTSLALEEVRQIAHDLRPYQLERLGLTNTLEYMLRYVRNSSDIDFETEVDNIDGLLSRESEINFYRIVQECINNIIKHSEATEASIAINRIENEINITCCDNGKGFDVRAIQHSKERGLGLTGLAERLSMLGGSYTIESAQGEGTTVLINIPATDGSV